jgi:hypothetical protein
MPDRENNVDPPVAGIRPPQSLQLGNNDNIAENWKLFKQKWRNYSIIANTQAQSNEYQVALFLNTLGDPALKVYNGFVFTSTEENRTVNEIITKFDEYAIGTVNATYERFLFNQRKQNDGESFDNFLSALRTLIKTCSFCDQCVDSLLMDRIVIGIRESEIQKALLKEHNLTLTQCISICKSMENAQTQGKILRPSGTTANTDAVSRKNNFKSPKSTTQQTHSTKNTSKCLWCGKTPHPRDKCPARASVCRKCEKKGHWDVVCQSQRAPKPKHHAPQQKSVNAVDVFLGSVEQSSTKGWNVDLTICGKPISFRIDTGADVTIMPFETFNKLEPTPDLAECHLQLSSPGGDLQCLGQFDAVLTNKGNEYHANIIVVHGNFDPLLSRDAACELGLVARIQNVTAMKTTPVHIKIRSGVKPLCLTSARRVPYPLRDAVQQELQKMQDADIIRPVTEPTEWCSPMVVVQKKSGGIRICVDLKELNHAVCRENYSLPLLDDMAPKLSGSKFFTKLDAASGFWQVPLDNFHDTSWEVCIQETTIWHHIGSGNLPAKNDRNSP